MEISSRALPAVAGERATMFVALELSKSTWLVALHSPVADKVSQYRFAGGDVTGLLALIVRKQAQAGPCCMDGACKRGDANFAWVYAIRT